MEKENHRSEYSVHRLLAFNEYCQSASQRRVLLVCCLYGVPALALLLLLEVVPLQKPSDGWSANWVYWSRLFISTILTSAIVMSQARVLTPDIALSKASIFVIACGVAVGFVGTVLLLAKYWMFPVPFTPSIGIAPYSVMIFVLGTIIIGTKDKVMLQNYYQYINFAGLLGSMLVVYPAYNTTFRSLEGNVKLAVVALLPMIKYGLKRLIAKSQTCDEDIVISLLASADLFDAIYMTKCMQSVDSLLIGVGIATIDMAQNVYAIRKLYKQSRSCRQHLQTRYLLQYVLDWVEITQSIDSKSLRFGSDQVRLQLSAHSQLTVDRLESLQMTESNSIPSRSTEPTRKTSVNQIFPVDAANSSASKDIEPKESEQLQIITEALRQLHQIEEVVVVEYIEAMIPVVCAIHLAVLFCMPNARCYDDLKGVTEDNVTVAVRNIFVYAVMELFSLVYVYVMVRRYFGVSVIYQLAFALEHEWQSYQGSFVSWILLVFQLLTAHV